MIPSEMWPDPVFALILKNHFLEALILVVGAVFIWAAFIRKPRDPNSRQHRKHHWRSSRGKTSKPGEVSGESTGVFGGKRRRKRRKHRPTNPTLAETGGLPPVRSADPESYSKD